MNYATLTDARVYLEKMTSSLAGQIKAKYNLIGTKWGHAHVETSADEMVRYIAHILGHSSGQESSIKNSTFLCWIAVPTDDSDLCIKTDSAEQEDKALRQFDEHGLFAAMWDFQRQATNIDEVESFLSQHLKCRVVPGLDPIMEGDINYRRLSWLAAVQANH